MRKKLDAGKLAESFLSNAASMTDTAETLNKVARTVNSMVPALAGTGVAANLASPVTAIVVFGTLTSLGLWNQYRQAKDDRAKEVVVRRMLQAVLEPFGTAARIARERGLDELPQIAEEPYNWMLVLDALITEQGSRVIAELEPKLQLILDRLDDIQDMVFEVHAVIVKGDKPPKTVLTWNIPTPSPSFTGQEENLERLREIVSSGKVTGITQPAGLNGFGGIGKTELALAYAHLNKDHYEAGYFLVADSVAALDAGLAKLSGVELPSDATVDLIADAKAKAINQLQRRERLLLVLDNVDEIAQSHELKEVLKALPKAHVILTCRHKDLGGTAALVEIKKMDEQTGALYLLREGLGNLDQNLWDWEHFQEADRDMAATICREFDGLPLALHHAGCAVRGDSLTLAEVWQMYQKKRDVLLANRGNTATATHPDSVSVMVELALERLRAKEPAAAELVICCAFLAPAAMYEGLFTHQTLEMAEPLNSQLDRFEEIRSVALRSGLVQRIPSDARLIMHRLTQAVILDLGGTETKHRLDGISNQAVVVWLTIGRYRTAVVQAVYAAQEAKRLLGPKDQVVLTSMGNLASTYWAMGRHSEGLSVEEDVLALTKEVLGDRHPYTLTSMNNLAETYRAMGRHADALSLLEEVLALRKEVLGDRHPNTLSSMNNLANTYWSIGRHSEALSINEKVLALKKEVLGERHPETLTSMHSLAGTYWSMGRHADGLSLLEGVLALRKEILGNRHPQTLSCINSLAGTYFSLGRLEESEALLRNCVSMSDDVLGPEHPDTIDTRENLEIVLAAIAARDGETGP